MICLGVESTAHTFGIGVINDKGNILADARSVFTTEKGGMIPSLVAEHHKNVCNEILEKALQEAVLTMKEIDLISYSQGPGLAPSLYVGLNFARRLSEENKIPVIGVNHCVAHLTIGELTTGVKDPLFLYVSGVNTQLIALSGDKFRIFGETLDIGLGNALDKFGRAAGLGFPAGPGIEKLAKNGKYIELPYVVKGMETSFSGILTYATNLLKKGEKIEDICHSFQEVCFSMLAEVAERGLAHTDKKELLLIGGVGANKRLSEMLDEMCKARKVKFYVVPLKYSGDQGVMIAWQGILEHKGGAKKRIEILPYERTDDVKVVWA